ncbi:MAG: transcriptional repressor [Nanobdellota archaeon]
MRNFFEQESTINELRKELHNVKKELKTVKKELKQYTTKEKQLNTTPVEEIEVETTSESKTTNEIPDSDNKNNKDNSKKTSSDEKTAFKGMKALEREALKKINKNRKQIIQETILQHINQQNTTPLELKKTIVDTKQYCSKATFYRYVQELEDKQQLQRITINGTTTLHPITKPETTYKFI